MKKYLSLILAVLMLVSFTACTQQAPSSGQDSIVSAYKEKAEEFIANGDYDSAIAVLEEGISATNSEELMKMLEDTQKAKEEAEASIPEEPAEPEVAPFNISDYLGWWSGDDPCFSFDIYDGEVYADIELWYARTDGSRLAQAMFSVSKSSIENNKIQSTYEDSFGNRGTAIIEFSENKIICTIFDVVPPAMGADWGIPEGTYVLTHHETETDPY